MATLYLHIGTPKTATTSIQMFCETNQEAFEKRGFCYPQFPYKYPHVAKRRNGHFLIGKNYKNDGTRDTAEEERIWKEGLEKVISLFGQYSNVILSDEGIWNIIALRKSDCWEDLKRILNEQGVDVKIIVYLRRQDSLAESTWNQRIKLASVERYAGMKWDAEKMHEILPLDYYKSLEYMADVFGKNNIIVRIFDRGNFVGGDVQSDFLNVLGIAMDEDFVLEKPEANLALKGNTHEIKRIINGLPGFCGETHHMVDRCIRICSDYCDPEYQYSMFSPDERRAFLAKYEESNRRVADEYLGTPGVDPFPDKKMPEQKWQPDNPHMYEDIIRYFSEVTFMQQEQIIALKKSVSEQQKIMAVQQKENEKLKARVDRISNIFKHPLKAAKNKKK